jgi:hypothetical protein
MPLPADFGARASPSALESEYRALASTLTTSYATAEERARAGVALCTALAGRPSQSSRAQPTHVLDSCILLLSQALGLSSTRVNTSDIAAACTSSPSPPPAALAAGGSPPPQSPLLLRQSSSLVSPLLLALAHMARSDANRVRLARRGVGPLVVLAITLLTDGLGAAGTEAARALQPAAPTPAPALPAPIDASWAARVLLLADGLAQACRVLVALCGTTNADDLQPAGGEEEEEGEKHDDGGGGGRERAAGSPRPPVRRVTLPVGETSATLRAAARTAAAATILTQKVLAVCVDACEAAQEALEFCVAERGTERGDPTFGAAAQACASAAAWASSALAVALAVVSDVDPGARSDGGSVFSALPVPTLLGALESLDPVGTQTQAPQPQLASPLAPAPSAITPLKRGSFRGGGLRAASLALLGAGGAGMDTPSPALLAAVASAGAARWRASVQRWAALPGHTATLRALLLTAAPDSEPLPSHHPALALLSAPHSLVTSVLCGCDARELGLAVEEAWGEREEDAAAAAAALSPTHALHPQRHVAAAVLRTVARPLLAALLAALVVEAASTSSIPSPARLELLAAALRASVSSGTAGEEPVPFLQRALVFAPGGDSAALEVLLALGEASHARGASSSSSSSSAASRCRFASAVLTGLAALLSPWNAATSARMAACGGWGRLERLVVSALVDEGTPDEPALAGPRRALLGALADFFVTRVGDDRVEEGKTDGAHVVFPRVVVPQAAAILLACLASLDVGRGEERSGLVDALAAAVVVPPSVAGERASVQLAVARNVASLAEGVPDLGARLLAASAAAPSSAALASTLAALLPSCLTAADARKLVAEAARGRETAWELLAVLARGITAQAWTSSPTALAPMDQSDGIAADSSAASVTDVGGTARSGGPAPPVTYDGQCPDTYWIFSGSVARPMRHAGLRAGIQHVSASSCSAAASTGSLGLPAWPGASDAPTSSKGYAIALWIYVLPDETGASQQVVTVSDGSRSLHLVLEPDPLSAPSPPPTSPTSPTTTTTTFVLSLRYTYQKHGDVYHRCSRKLSAGRWYHVSVSHARPAPSAVSRVRKGLASLGLSGVTDEGSACAFFVNGREEGAGLLRFPNFGKNAKATAAGASTSAAVQLCVGGDVDASLPPTSALSTPAARPFSGCVSAVHLFDAPLTPSLASGLFHLGPGYRGAFEPAAVASHAANACLRQGQARHGATGTTHGPTRSKAAAAAREAALADVEAVLDGKLASRVLLCVYPSASHGGSEGGAHAFFGSNASSSALRSLLGTGTGTGTSTGAAPAILGVGLVSLDASDVPCASELPLLDVLAAGISAEALLEALVVSAPVRSEDAVDAPAVVCRLLAAGLPFRAKAGAVAIAAAAAAAVGVCGEYATVAGEVGSGWASLFAAALAVCPPSSLPHTLPPALLSLALGRPTLPNELPSWPAAGSDDADAVALAFTTFFRASFTILRLARGPGASSSASFSSYSSVVVPPLLRPFLLLAPSLWLRHGVTERAAASMAAHLLLYAANSAETAQALRASPGLEVLLHLHAAAADVAPSACGPLLALCRLVLTGGDVDFAVAPTAPHVGRQATLSKPEVWALLRRVALGIEEGKMASTPTLRGGSGGRGRGGGWGGRGASTRLALTGILDLLLQLSTYSDAAACAIVHCMLPDSYGARVAEVGRAMGALPPGTAAQSGDGNGDGGGAATPGGQTDAATVQWGGAHLLRRAGAAGGGEGGDADGRLASLSSRLLGKLRSTAAAEGVQLFPGETDEAEEEGEAPISLVVQRTDSRLDALFLPVAAAEARRHEYAAVVAPLHQAQRDCDTAFLRMRAAPSASAAEGGCPPEVLAPRAAYETGAHAALAASNAAAQLQLRGPQPSVSERRRFPLVVLPTLDAQGLQTDVRRDPLVPLVPAAAAPGGPRSFSLSTGSFSALSPDASFTLQPSVADEAAEGWAEHAGKIRTLAPSSSFPVHSADPPKHWLPSAWMLNTTAHRRAPVSTAKSDAAVAVALAANDAPAPRTPAGKRSADDGGESGTDAAAPPSLFSPADARLLRNAVSTPGEEEGHPSSAAGEEVETEDGGESAPRTSRTDPSASFASGEDRSDPRKSSVATTMTDFEAGTALREFAGGAGGGAQSSGLGAAPAGAPAAAAAAAAVPVVLLDLPVTAVRPFQTSLGTFKVTADRLDFAPAAADETATAAVDAPSGRLPPATPAAPSWLDESTRRRYLKSILPPIEPWSIPVGALASIEARRHQQQPLALELFASAGASPAGWGSGATTSHLIAFASRADRDAAVQAILRLRAPMLAPYVSRPRAAARELGTRWRSRQVSNFDFLCGLNRIAGRSFNDLAQYPVFPWVLADYTSPSIDLADPAVYRDLAYPVAAQTEDRRRPLRAKFGFLREQFEEQARADAESASGAGAASAGSGSSEAVASDQSLFFGPPFHFGSCMMKPATVGWFLMRVEPTASYHIICGDGRFDKPDRLFHSVAEAWRSASTSDADIKELVPQFFTDATFLRNEGGLALGFKQDGTLVDDVLLPPWAADADAFVRIQRAALESEVVSARLHLWVDLVFGHKQRPRDLPGGSLSAERCVNAFHALMYPGFVSFEAIRRQSPDLYRRVCVFVSEYGCLPTVLFPFSERRAALGTGRGFRRKGRAGDVRESLRGDGEEDGTGDGEALGEATAAVAPAAARNASGSPEPTTNPTAAGGGLLPYDPAADVNPINKARAPLADVDDVGKWMLFSRLGRAGAGGCACVRGVAAGAAEPPLVLSPWPPSPPTGDGGEAARGGKSRGLPRDNQLHKLGRGTTGRRRTESQVSVVSTAAGDAAAGGGGGGGGDDGDRAELVTAPAPAPVPVPLPALVALRIHRSPVVCLLPVAGTDVVMTVDSARETGFHIWEHGGQASSAAATSTDATAAAAPLATHRHAHATWWRLELDSRPDEAEKTLRMLSDGAAGRLPGQVGASSSATSHAVPPASAFKRLAITSGAAAVRGPVRAPSTLSPSLEGLLGRARIPDALRPAPAPPAPRLGPGHSHWAGATCPPTALAHSLYAAPRGTLALVSVGYPDGTLRVYASATGMLGAGPRMALAHVLQAGAASTPTCVAPIERLHPAVAACSPALYGLAQLAGGIGSPTAASSASAPAAAAAAAAAAATSTSGPPSHLRPLDLAAVSVAAAPVGALPPSSSTPALPPPSGVSSAVAAPSLPQRAAVAVGCLDGSVRLHDLDAPGWAAARLEEVPFAAFPAVHAGPVTCASSCAPLDVLATAGADNCVVLFSLSSLAPRLRVPLAPIAGGDAGPVGWVCVSPARAVLAHLPASNVLVALSLSTGRPLCPPAALPFVPRALCLSEDGATLLVGGDGPHVLVLCALDLAVRGRIGVNGARLQAAGTVVPCRRRAGVVNLPLPFPSPVTSLALTRDETSLWVGLESGEVRIFVG